MYHSGDDVGAIVADIGSFSTRIGHAGNDVPAAYFPSVITDDFDCMNRNHLSFLLPCITVCGGDNQ